MLHTIIDTVVWIVWSWWYVWIFIMMALESTMFPIPSEVVVIPAWYLVSTWEMNFFWVLIMWTWWVLLWSSLNYFFWYYLWEKVIKNLINKYWKYVFIKIESYEKTESFFLKHWAITVFIWRLIIVIRHFISIPAGIFKMNYLKFISYTFLWWFIWNMVLIWIGYIAWENKELISQYSKEVTIWLLFFIILTIWIYISKNSKKTNI